MVDISISVMFDRVKGVSDTFNYYVNRIDKSKSCFKPEVVVMHCNGLSTEKLANLVVEQTITRREYIDAIDNIRSSVPVEDLTSVLTLQEFEVLGEKLGFFELSVSQLSDRLPILIKELEKRNDSTDKKVR